MSRRPQFSRHDLDSEDEDAYSSEASNDSLSSLSFGALSAAQRKLDEEEDKNSESEPDSDGGFFEEPTPKSHTQKKKKNKHAPSETSAKKPVSKVREIPGLLDGTKYAKTKYHDIRFDSAFGKVNESEVRRNYKFLDEYRQKELEQVQSVLKDPKKRNKLSEKELQDLDYIAKSTKSRLDALKNKDLEREVIKDYKKKTGKEFVKRSDKRKLVQVARFQNMKGKQREKVLERKRKRRFGKEMRQFERNYGDASR
ncbi:hypothetical protein KL930_003493 [Ogataea haglerorum]|uniref:rRNA biogenesis protein RRP36 n=1 Tax=Ogataea haglerorum TaxID=1937702 RepID=A0ABQ7RFE8_9ASCO|nr:hypothetical protein KL950_002891 [Ogataea haglerorum]KAG7718475.1 hypothetical protein KL913_002470 [Ogataea haglerorum]KAG7718676.1 hypothetical protein KL949_002672 [Ogataea haglerorum]KAG7737382.1 hypothetical protein KL923_003771 [Ogataea haglerorum]KAG7757481.1 hypothetical protein KL947_003109 [Ogataea haglerorum]